MANFLICVVGPTAVGKTAFGIELAKHFHSEIISADSRQFFKEISIGTAKPSTEELSQVPHHFIDNLSISEDYNAGQFERDSLKKTQELFSENNIQLVVGGSGLYVNALCFGFDDLPEVKPEIRKELNEEFELNGIEYLQEKIKQLDPVYAIKADLNNPQRIIRALEICISSGKAYSSFKTGKKNNRNFTPIFIGLNDEREKLYDRINKRVDLMLEQGLIEEVKSVENYKSKGALKTVGYQEFYEHFDGKHSLEEAIELVKRNSRRYAKRQITWFKKSPNIKWFKRSELQACINYINATINENSDNRS